jgi:hypothetical protein
VENAFFLFEYQICVPTFIQFGLHGPLNNVDYLLLGDCLLLLRYDAFLAEHCVPFGVFVLVLKATRESIKCFFLQVYFEQN